MKKVIFLTLLIGLIILGQINTNASDDSTIIGPEIIHKQYDKILTLNQILTLYSSELGEIEVISDTYVGNGDIPGVYTITLGIDSYQKEISIKVMQTLGNVIAVADDDTLYIYKDTILTNNEIINTFINAKQLPIGSDTSISVITNQYEKNSNTPGIYLFEFKVTSTDGSEATYETYIKVSPENQLVPDIELTGSNGSLFLKFIEKYTIHIFVIIIIALMITNKKLKKKRGITR